MKMRPWWMLVVAGCGIAGCRAPLKPLKYPTLYQAAVAGDLDEVKTHVKRKADVNARGGTGAWALSSGGQTALHGAAINGHLGVAQFLLDNGAEADMRDNDSSTPFMCAVLGGHSDVAALFLQHGADINAQTPDGWTVLTMATMSASLEEGESSLETVRWLLENGADPNAGGVPPLFMTIDSPDVDALLRQYGARD